VKLLRQVKVHYASARVLLDYIYRTMNSVMIYIGKVDIALENKDYDEIDRLNQVMPSRLRWSLNDKLNNRGSDDFKFREEWHSLQSVKERDAEFIAEFNRQCGEDFQDIHECDVCERQLFLWQLNRPKRPYRDWGELRFRENAGPDDICTRVITMLQEKQLEIGQVLICADCHKSMKSGTVPQFSRFNNMHAEPVPECMRDWTIFMKLLIQRVRPCKNLVLLNTIANKDAKRAGAASRKFKAVKGNVIRMPLPTAANQEKTLAVLPDPTGIDILLSDVTNVESKGSIVQGIVNCNKLFEACNFLKQNNPHYADVTVISEADFKTALADKISAADADGDAELQRKPKFQVKGPIEYPAEANVQEKPPDYDFTEYHVYNYNEDVPEADDMFNLLWNRFTARPIGALVENVDLLSHPELHPEGLTGANSPRPVPFDGKRLRQYYYGRFASSDTRWSTNTNYIAEVYDLFLQLWINSGMFGLHSTGQNKFTNKGLFQKAMLSKDKDLLRSISRIMQNVEGSPQHMEKERRHLQAMDEEFGPAHIFLTLSCAESEWTDLHAYLKRKHPEIQDYQLRNNTIAVLNKYPISFMQYWKIRVQAFINAMLYPKDKETKELKESFFGKRVMHHFIRNEFQARGTPHAHMKLWLEGGPVHGQATEHEFLNFVAKNITCRLPNPDTEKELHDQVKKHQTHKCKPSYCFSSKKRSASTSAVLKCRGGFPRAVSDTLCSNSIESVIKGRKVTKARKFLYTVPRAIEEVHINDYHPTVMLAWRANHDVQMVAENCYVLNRYITNYLTKEEKGWSEAKYMNIDQMQSITSKARSMINQFTSTREVGIPEMAMVCLGHKYIDTDVTFVDVSLGPSDRRTRKLRDSKTIASLPDGSTDLFETGFLDYYRVRPNSMADMSVYEVLKNFTYKPISEAEFNRGDQDVGEPSGRGRRKNERHSFAFTRQDGTTKYYQFVRRDKPAVVSPNYMPLGHDDEQKTRYMFNMLQLYVPYRYENFILPARCQTMSEKIAHFTEQMKASPLLQESVARKQTLARSLEQAEKWMEEAEADEAIDDMPIVLDELAQAKRDKREKELQEATSVKLNEFMYRTSAEYFERMNAEQKKIFSEVVNTIQLWENNLHLYNADTPAVKPLRLFVSGVAGTGKSFLIQALSLAVDELYAQRSESGDFTESCVVRMGPTGVCASSINGSTIHSVLKISIQKNACELEQKGLRDHDVLAMREVFGRKKLFMLDELSMVSNVTFAKIDHRLNQIFRTHPTSDLPQNCTSFGGRHFILFGDFLQLAPVVTGDDAIRTKDSSPFVFDKGSKRTAKRVFGWQSFKDLFSQFEYFELVQQMRQKDDAAFQNLLNSVRLGNLSKEQYDMLKKREIILNEKEPTSAHYAELTQHVEKLFEADQQAVCLFPQRDDVAQFNEAMLKKKGLQPVSVQSIDRFDGQIKKKAIRRPTKKKRHSNKRRDSNKTGGLEDDVVLAEKARVMLRRNTNASKKLVNGSLGTIEKIHYKRGIVDYVDVKFDHLDEIESITRVTQSYDDTAGTIASREQFALQLAYGMTIHKCQGLSLNSVVIDGTRGIRSNAQFYVALSRARKLDQVHLVGFQPHHIACERRCVMKINELHAQYNKRVIDEGSGLSTLPVYNVEKDINCIDERIPRQAAVSGAKKFTGSIAVRDALQEMEIDQNQPSTSAGTKGEGKTSRKRKRDANVALMFMNTVKPESCYMNALMQGLLYCNGFREFFLNADVAHLNANQQSIINEMRKILVNFVKRPPIAMSLNDFRTALSDRFRPGTGYQCVTEAFETLVEKLPELNSMFSFEQRMHNVCLTCRVTTTSATETKSFFGLEKPENTNQMTYAGIEEFNQLEKIPDWNCGYCGKRNGDGERRTEISFGPNQRLLMIFMRASVVKCDIVGFNFNVDRVLFGNDSCRWRLKAVLLYFAPGHYIAYMRQPEGTWLKSDCLGKGGISPRSRTVCIDAGETPDCPYLRDVRSMLFERV